MAKKRPSVSVPTETKTKRDRISIDVLPGDREKLLFLQARRKRITGKRQAESFSDLAHETWLKKLPKPPKNFKPQQRQHISRIRNGASRTPDMPSRGVFATPLDKH